MRVLGMLYAYKHKASIDPRVSVNTHDKIKVGKIFRSALDMLAGPNMVDGYDANTGLIGLNAFVNLAKQLGLVALPPVNVTYSCNFLENILKNYGPMWAAGYWHGYGHVVVVSGADPPSGDVAIVDPGPAYKEPYVIDIAEFNEKIATDVPNPMMYLP